MLIAWYAPIFILTVVLLRLSRTGRVFAAERCVGLEGRPFRKWGFAALDGNRGIDRFVTASGLNYIPAAFNVLIGQMSLVGPDPRKARSDSATPSRAKGVFAGPAIRPGLFGFGPAAGDRQAWREASYIVNWTLARDLAILLRLLSTAFTEAPDVRRR